MVGVCVPKKQALGLSKFPVGRDGRRACGSAGGQQEGCGKMGRDPQRGRAGRGHRDRSVPVLVPSLLTVGCGGHRTALFALCPLGKAESRAPCLMTLPSSWKAAGEDLSSEAEPSCISRSSSPEAVPGLPLPYLLAVGLR